ncbi:MAG: tetratricopeptide repeat protein, partial [Candidatus Eisenbacteria bacterium]
MDRALPMAMSDAHLRAPQAGGEESLALAENLARGSSDPEQAREAARIFALEGLRERAIDVLRQGILTHPRHSEMLASLADLLSRTGTFEEADLYFGKALESEPKNVETWYLQGLHHGRQGHVAPAQAAYEEVVRLKPDHVKAWVNLGLALADGGDRDGARRALERAVRADPGCAEAHSNLGVLLAEAGHKEEALDEFRRAVDINPDCSESHFN